MPPYGTKNRDTARSKQKQAGGFWGGYGGQILSKDKLAVKSVVEVFGEDGVTVSVDESATEVTAEQDYV